MGQALRCIQVDQSNVAIKEKFGKYMMIYLNQDAIVCPGLWEATWLGNSHFVFSS